MNFPKLRTPTELACGLRESCQHPESSCTPSHTSPPQSHYYSDFAHQGLAARFCSSYNWNHKVCSRDPPVPPVAVVVEQQQLFSRLRSLHCVTAPQHGLEGIIYSERRDHSVAIPKLTLLMVIPDSVSIKK